MFKKPDAPTKPRLPGEALVRYFDAEMEVIEPGAFVVCAQTGRTIPLKDLKYWSVDQQEPYADAEAAVARWKVLNGEGRA